MQLLYPLQQLSATRRVNVYEEEVGFPTSIYYLPFLLSYLGLHFDNVQASVRKAFEIISISLDILSFILSEFRVSTTTKSRITFIPRPRKTRNENVQCTEDDGSRKTLSAISREIIAYKNNPISVMCVRIYFHFSLRRVSLSRNRRYVLTKLRELTSSSSSPSSTSVVDIDVLLGVFERLLFDAVLLESSDDFDFNARLTSVFKTVSISYKIIAQNIVWYV